MRRALRPKNNQVGFLYFLLLCPDMKSHVGDTGKGDITYIGLVKSISLYYACRKTSQWSHGRRLLGNNSRKDGYIALYLETGRPRVNFRYTELVMVVATTLYPYILHIIMHNMITFKMAVSVWNVWISIKNQEANLVVCMHIDNYSLLKHHIK